MMRAAARSAYVLTISIAAGLPMGCGSSHQNFVTFAVESANKDGFQDIRDDSNQPSRMLPSIQGEWNPWFSACYLFAQRTRPQLVCKRSGGRKDEPEATQLLQYVRSSLPVGYREKKCDLGFPGQTHCTAWSAEKRRSPLILLTALPGDGGNYQHTLQIYAPPRLGIH